MAVSRDRWAGCPPGWQRLIVTCEGHVGRGHPRKFLGRGWQHRFGDGFPAVAFAPSRWIETTQVTHADGGKTFRFGCPWWPCAHRPEVSEEKVGEWVARLLELGRADSKGEAHA